VQRKMDAMIQEAKTKMAKGDKKGKWHEPQETSHWSLFRHFQSTFHTQVSHVCPRSL